MSSRGKLVVFEGIDGSGTETQSKELLKHLEEEGVPCVRIFYPDYEGAFGKMIHDFLHKNNDLSTELQFVIYAGDMVKDKERIDNWLNEGKIVVADRYYNSTIAYQGVRGFSRDKAVTFARDFKIPVPDIVIYLKISSGESRKRKMSEHGKLDRNEEDNAFLDKVNDSYQKLAGDNIFGKWFIIDGEKSRKEIFSGVLKILEKF